MLQIRIKRGRTVNGHHHIKMKKIIDKKKSIDLDDEISKSITNDFDDAKEDERRKSFRYLNGGDDDESDDKEKIKNKNNIQPNGREVDNCIELKQNGKEDNNKRPRRRNRI